MNCDFVELYDRTIFPLDFYDVFHVLIDGVFRIFCLEPAACLRERDFSFEWILDQVDEGPGDHGHSLTIISIPVINEHDKSQVGFLILILIVS